LDAHGHSFIQAIETIKNYYNTVLIIRMANRYIPTAGNLAVWAIWYGFFSNIIILHQCGLYGAAGYPQEITVHTIRCYFTQETTKYLV
jgi:hypothetical protein